MSLFGWFARPANFKRFEDSYALSRAGLYAGLRDAIGRCLEMGELVFLVAHFPDTFNELTRQLDDWQVEFEIVTSPLDRRRLRQLGKAADSGRVFVNLAEMLIPLEPDVDGVGSELPVAAMVIERHPLPWRDARIESFARSLNCPVQLGYFLSLGDVVIRKTISDQSIELLKQLGLKDHELITSHMITSRLDKVLKRLAGPDHPDLAADSVDQWFKLNRPE